LIGRDYSFPSLVPALSLGLRKLPLSLFLVLSSKAITFSYFKTKKKNNVGTDSYNEQTTLSRKIKKIITVLDMKVTVESHI
jgi:hypothetical protein